jgi:hypothetical protein
MNLEVNSIETSDGEIDESGKEDRVTRTTLTLRSQLFLANSRSPRFQKQRPIPMRGSGRERGEEARTDW